MTSAYSGYNTDVNGFRETLKPLVGGRKRISALILGTGGASNAVAYVLKIMDIPFIYVSRSPDNKDQISYADLTPEIISDHQLIINTTPVGMFPKVRRSASNTLSIPKCKAHPVRPYLQPKRDNIPQTWP